MNPSAYRPEIDGLRALAVIAVVLYHADAALLPSGFVGVDVFFVISGYLITGMLATEQARTGRIDLADFWARRARRILPALLVVTCAVAIAAAALLSRHAAFEAISGSAVASLLFVANFWFQATTGGYFDAAAETMPLMHLWSLAVEEQFYLVFPLLLAAWADRAPATLRRRIAVAALLSLLLAEYWVRTAPEVAFFQMPARFWELAAGSLVALSPSGPRRPAFDRLLVPAGTLLVLVACLYTRAWGAFPASSALPAVAGTAIALLGIHRDAASGPVAAFLRWRPMAGVGLLSYSLYLWHWPLLVFDDRLRMAPASLSWRLALCVAALGLAWVSWRFVEQSVRRLRTGAARTLLAAATGLAACVVVVLVSGRAAGGTPSARALADRARADLFTESRCHLSWGEALDAASLAACSSVTGRHPGVVIWGDSHAAAWRPFAAAVATHDSVPLAGVTMNSCWPGGAPSPRAERACADLNAFVLDALSSRPVDTLIVSMRWPLDEADTSLGDRLAGLHAALPRLRGVRRVLIIGPLPQMRRAVPECIRLGWVETCGMSRSEFDTSAAPVWSGLEALAARYPNVELVDPGPWFCSPGDCPAVRDGSPLYRDKDHLAATAARGFAAAWLSRPARYDRTPTRAAAPRETP